MGATDRVGVVIVTYNRLACLKKVLENYENSTSRPDYILVLDNASRVDTKEYLEKWKGLESDYRKIVVRLDINEGSSKGFSVALNKAMELDANWIFVSDDDAFPTQSTISELKAFINHQDCDLYAAICAKVINYGNIDISHRRITEKKHNRIKSIPVGIEAYNDTYFELDEFSYVGTAINKKALEEYGTTKDDLYIFYDDTEHSLRLKQFGPIICAPQVEIIHDKKPKTERTNFQTYYYIRNRGWMINHYFGEKCVNQFIRSVYLRNVFRPSAILKKYTNREIELYRDALEDLKSQNMGINKKYLPGWKK